MRIFSVKGISNMISTLILVGIFLTVIIASSVFALSVFEIESQNAEFAQAEGNMIALAQIIEEVSLHPYSSSYLRFNTRVGRLNFMNNWGVINVTISDNSTTTTFSFDLGVLEYIGGEKVGVPGEKILRGNNSLIIMDETEPLGVVVEKQENGARIVVDFSRIRVTSLGIVEYRDENGEEKNFSLVEVKFIDLNLIKVYSGAGPTTLIVENLNLTTNSLRLNSPATITVTINGESESVIVGESADVVLIDFVVANIGFTFRGG